MANQISPSVTNPTIADIYGYISSDRLELTPDFQRKFVWTHEHQEKFLDTILKGYPFPEIYVCQGITDTKKMITTQKVIDGQQRLTTIKNYIENDFRKPLKDVPSFESLSEDEKQDFLAYKIIVRDIGRVEDHLVREIFRRINLTKFKLDDIEIHNAIYDGSFIQMAKDLSNEVELDKFGVFHESDFTRMADVHFFLLVMSTLKRGGYFPRDTEVEKCIAEFNEDFPDSHNVKSKILSAIGIIQDFDLDADSIWFRKSCFFTLVIELCWADKINNDVKSRLISFGESVLSSKGSGDNDYTLFYHYIYSGTNDRKARVLRSEIVKRHVFC